MGKGELEWDLLRSEEFGCFEGLVSDRRVDNNLGSKVGLRMQELNGGYWDWDWDWDWAWDWDWDWDWDWH